MKRKAKITNISPKTILKINKVRGMTLMDVRIHFQITINETVWYLHKDKPMGQWKRTQVKTGTRMYRHLIYDNLWHRWRCRAVGKRQSFSKRHWVICMQTPDPYLTSYLTRQDCTCTGSTLHWLPVISQATHKAGIPHKTQPSICMSEGKLTYLRQAKKRIKNKPTLSEKTEWMAGQYHHANKINSSQCWVMPPIYSLPHGSNHSTAGSSAAESCLIVACPLPEHGLHFNCWSLQEYNSYTPAPIQDSSTEPVPLKSPWDEAFAVTASKPDFSLCLILPPSITSQHTSYASENTTSNMKQNHKATI